MTTNHGYNTPESGATDWDIPLNENFAVLDEDVEIRDQASNRGSYTPVAGAKFLATNTGEVHVGDGDTWQPLGDITRVDGGIYVGGSPPNNPDKHDIWIDTSEL